MAVYLSLSDCDGAPPGLKEADLVLADIFIETHLRRIGVAPVSVALPNSTLTEIARQFAYGQAAHNAIKETDSPFIKLRDGFIRTAETLASGLTADAVIPPQPSGGGGGAGSGGTTVGVSFLRG